MRAHVWIELQEGEKRKPWDVSNFLGQEVEKKWKFGKGGDCFKEKGRVVGSSGE